MPRKKGKGRAVKRARQKFGAHYESEDLKLAAHSMVINRGHVSKDIRVLIQDFRQVMEPFTAASLKATKKNALKDFVTIAGPLHVTHLIMFSQTELGDNMKIARLPRGPTLHFKLEEFSLANDVLASLKKRHTHKKQFLYQPLLILNGFNTATSTDSSKGEENKPDFHMKLLATTLQNMFPSINVTKVDLNDIRRCVLFNYNKTDKTIDFRQYYIRLMPVGLSKPVKKLVQERLPDMSNYQDISEYIEKGGLLSESEAELDGVDNQVEVKKDVNIRGSINLKNTTSAIRLSEIGPRLKLRLVKIEEGICDGEVLYHDYIKKSPEDLKRLREKPKTKKKAEQKEKPKSNGKSNERKRKTQNEDMEDEDDEDSYDETTTKQAEIKNEDEDLEYYRQELGEEPDQEFLAKRKNSGRGNKKRARFQDEFNVKEDNEQVPLNNKKPRRSSNQEIDEEKSKELVKFNSKSSSGNKQARFLGFSKNKIQKLTHKNKKSK